MCPTTEQGRDRGIWGRLYRMYPGPGAPLSDPVAEKKRVYDAIMEGSMDLQRWFKLFLEDRRPYLQQRSWNMPGFESTVDSFREKSEGGKLSVNPSSKPKF